MKYDLVKPCKTCPFRIENDGFKFPYRRAEQIVYADGGFACHSTTTKKGRGVNHKEAQACAGRLIVLERSEQPDQMMRICERIGLYDRRKLKMDTPGVFEDIDDFMDNRVDEDSDDEEDEEE